MLERAVVDRFGDREVLVATKDGRVVVVVPGGRHPHVGTVLQEELRGPAVAGRWCVAAGRAFPGAYGVARSYEEAREALGFAERLDLDTDVVHARDLLVYRVLARDRAALVDLVRDVLGPLEQSRGGAEVLLDTLHAVLLRRGRRDRGRPAAARLGPHRHLPPGAGHPAHRVQRHPAGPAVPLHTAVLGARLLEWPRTPLPVDS